MNLPIEFDRPVCGDLGEACSREWLETNGIGGFACSTIAGLNTRRYHCAADRGYPAPGGTRRASFKAGRDTGARGDQRFELSVNRYQARFIREGTSIWPPSGWIRFPCSAIAVAISNSRRPCFWSTAKTPSSFNMSCWATCAAAPARWKSAR